MAVKYSPLMYGCDVSKWQGIIDMEKLNTDFLIIRAGNSESRDKYAFANYCMARQCGIPVGFYWYYMGKSLNQVEKETECFLEFLKGKICEMPICIDLEDSSYNKCSVKLTRQLIKRVSEMIESAGYYVCVYANKDWYDRVLDDEIKSKYDIWYARYNSTGCNDHPGIKLWQYTNQEIKIGIDGNVDADKAFVNYPKIIRKAGLNHLEGKF